jgi:DNA/RNA-binding domain of Phe-tRNA-synthetase-like protein
MAHPPSQTKTVQISMEIFERFPDYCRGIVIADSVNNVTSPDDLVDQLRAEEQKIRTELAGVDLNTLARLESWRDAFRMLGIKPTRMRPSIDALIRRVVSGNPLPSINALVDIGNLLSLRFMLPVGVHAIDVVQQGMQLRKATGNEIFQPFGSDEQEQVEPGEIIFTDGDQVMTRRWVWRQAEHTLVHYSTSAVEYNVDGMPPVTPAIVEEVCGQLSEWVGRYCGGKIKSGMLNRSNPEIPLR